jgi:hypothetical protein
MSFHCITEKVTVLVHYITLYFEYCPLSIKINFIQHNKRNKLFKIFWNIRHQVCWKKNHHHLTYNKKITRLASLLLLLLKQELHVSSEQATYELLSQPSHGRNYINVHIQNIIWKFYFVWVVLLEVMACKMIVFLYHKNEQYFFLFFAVQRDDFILGLL